MTDRTFRDITLTYADPREWVLGRILERRAREHPDRPYLQWEDTPPLSFAQTNREVNRLAHGFAAAGVRHGDRVLLFLPNSRDFVLAWFALAKLGAVEVPVNIHYRGKFLSHVANNCGARLAVTDASLLPSLMDCGADLAHLRVAYVMGKVPESAAGSPLELRPFAALRTDDESDPGVAVAHTDIAAILFTSGTTGPSKGVLMPHAQFYFFAEQGASLVRLTADDVYMNSFPLFHGNAQFLTTYPCLIRGAHAVLYEKFSASEWIDRIRRNGVTAPNLLGVTMDFVFKQPPRPTDADNRLRVIYAVPTAHQILAEFKARFGIEACVDAFGQTETCLPLMTPYGDDMGELVVRHRKPWTLCAGYNAHPEGTLKAMRNLWWHTGDGMRKDAQGWYYFVDRVNDALRVRGENVSSYEVEQVVLAHPAVAECSVFGVPDKRLGEEVGVAILLRPDMTVSAEALREHCGALMARHKIPRYIWFVKDHLPRNANGKFLKRELRETLPISEAV